MDARTRRPARYDRLAHYTSACFLGLVLGSCTTAVDPIADEITVERVAFHLPTACEKLRIKYDIKTDWDPVTETYPRNEAWENCMGVGRK